MQPKKLIYLPYVLKRTDYKKLKSYVDYVSEIKGITKAKVLAGMLRCFFKFDTAFLDYFYLGFYEKTDTEIATYASTWYMYNFQRRMNDPTYVSFFQDKAKFYQKFAKFIRHDHFLPQGKNSEELKIWLDEHKPEYLMAKDSQGQVGRGIEKLNVGREGEAWIIDGKDLNTFLAYAKSKNLDLIETFIRQHQFLQRIAPSALSTIRVMTILDKEGKVNIEGAILRMSTGRAIDNYDAGGVSAAIDVQSGMITGAVHYKDPRKTESSGIHPISGAQVTGLVLPQWRGILDMLHEAALIVPQIRTVGWDVVLTDEGPALLEGNHNWDKTLWQKPYGEGMKEVLEAYA